MVVLVGGIPCLVDSGNERDLGILSRCVGHSCEDLLPREMITG